MNPSRRPPPARLALHRARGALHQARLAWLALFLALSTTTACKLCGVDPTVPCTAPDHCPSAICGADGLCVPVDAGAGPADGEGEGEGDGAGEGEGEGEGEGDGAGEGEGEGDGAGEGEGEGEGELPFASCEELHAAQPGAPSGAYTLAGGLEVECDMVSDGGGWTLLVRYNDGDACPADWQPGPEGGCMRDGFESETDFAPPYVVDEMRGAVRAYAFGGSDAFQFRPGDIGIDALYVDGVSITVGSPRRHVWTFAHAVSDSTPQFSASVCPCAGGAPPPAFVGDAYSCESPTDAIDGQDTSLRYFDLDDVLWDGLDVGGACAGAPESAPSFLVTLDQATQDGFHVRGLCDEQSGDEDFAVIHIELWVR